MSLDPEVTTVAVAPTATTVWSGDVRRHGLVTVQVQNLDATQTFSGSLLRKVAGALGWSTSTMGDLASISPAGTLDGAGNPLDSVTVDVDVEGTAELAVVGFMSGAGGDVSVSVRTSGLKR